MDASFATRSRQSPGDMDAAGDPFIYEWQDPPQARRDWKKALLVLGLGTLSWVATYVGMLELIQSNMAELSLAHKVIIGFSVAMLMTMIIWLLDQMFAPLPFLTKLAYIAGYMFLTIISVGFGFGFYWKVLESRSEASRSAESAVVQVKNALHGASARLDQLQATLDQLTQVSAAKAVEERERGTSCPNSRPGDGPRRRLRDADAARFGFAAQFIKGRAGQTKAEMSALDADLKKITTAAPSTIDPKTGTRNKFLQSLTRRLELTATGFNAFRTDPQLRQIRAELAERAAKTQFPNSNGGTFLCPDPQLQSALRGVVRAIDQLPELGKPQIATVEGAQAVVEAFRRLTTTFYGVLTFKLPPSADELRALQHKAIQSIENAAERQGAIDVGNGGLSKRDYIPLAIAVFVDLCLLLVSIGRPMNRLNGLIPKMRDAERGPVYQILSRFDDIHRDRMIREKFEIFRHVVFDFNADYYVAVPLDAPRNRNPDEVKALQQEAHLLSNLFASFEKERIFYRVYNPLLTRKTITKKLRRQGSKFADSMAFRTYRFRNGAWSEIILGAVMGASRGVHTQRRAELISRGHSMSMPAEIKTSEEEVRGEPEDSLGGAVSSDAERGRSAPVDAELRRKYGRYAESMAQMPERADELELAPPAQRWPYRKPDPGPGEADVDVHVAANSNASPKTRATDDGNGHGNGNGNGNIVAMALPQAANDWNGAATQPGGHVGPEARDMLAVAQDAQAAGAREGSPRPPITAPGSDALGTAHERSIVNVRLTERTADFSVPVTDAELPQRILQSVGRDDTVQLSMDLAPTATPAAATADEHDHHNPILIGGAQPVTAAEFAQQPADQMAKAAATPLAIADQTSTDIANADITPSDPFLRVAQRFAAQRSTHE